MVGVQLAERDPGEADEVGSPSGGPEEGRAARLHSSRDEDDWPARPDRRHQHDDENHMGRTLVRLTELSPVRLICELTAYNRPLGTGRRAPVTSCTPAAIDLVDLKLLRGGDNYNQACLSRLCDPR